MKARSKMTSDQDSGSLPDTDVMHALSQLAAIRTLTFRARQISPGRGMMIYVADIEAILGIRPPDPTRPHKLGANAESR